MCHSILLNKLEHYGVRGIALKLLKSFLTNCSQFVADQNLRTNDAVNRFGVPQGSNLGPLLFLIYINDIPNALFSKPRLFADDTYLVIHAPNPSLLENSVNRELVNVYEWTKANKITVNPKKTSVLIIPPKATSPPPNIHLVFNGSIISINESVKYLGITTDKKLNFEMHIKQLESKISRSIGIMTKLRHVLPAKALCTLYYSVIHPHLLYGITIWGTTFKSCLKRLSSLQNRAIKQIVDCHWQSNANPCYAQLNILKLNNLYTHEIAKLMFKYAHKTTPIAFSSFFTPVISIHTRITRLASYSNNLYLPRYKTNKLQKSFKFQGIKIWNSIPNDLRKLSFNQFKMKCKKILLSNY